MTKDEIINQSKKHIENLSTQQTDLYEQLVDVCEIKPDSREEQLLWDYVFNNNKEQTFSEFLKLFGEDES